MNRNLIFIALGLAGLYFYKKMRLGQSINVLFRGVKVGGNLLRPELKLELTVQNPTNTPTTFKSFSGSVYVNGQYLANFSSFGDQVIKANAESPINIIAKPGLLSAAKNIISFLKNPKQGLTAELKGTANFDNLVLPINQIITV